MTERDEQYCSNAVAIVAKEYDFLTHDCTQMAKEEAGPVNVNDPLHPDAVAITAFRVLPNGEGQQYTTTEFPDDPWGAISRRIRRAVTHIQPTREVPEPYAVLDALNANGDIVQDFAVPDARSWKWVYRKFHFRVDNDLSERGKASERHNRYG